MSISNGVLSANVQSNGVTTFNNRAGAVSLTSSDVSGAGGVVYDAQGAIHFGTYSESVEINGDSYKAYNAKWDGSNWQRVDTTKVAWLEQANIQNNMLYEGYPALSYWVCQPGSNPIGAFGTAAGWTLLQSYSQYHDVTVGGYGFEIDGNYTYPYARVQHATVGSLKRTGMMTNSYIDESGRDDSTKNSWWFGVSDDGSASGDVFKVQRAASGSAFAWTDLLSVSSSAQLQIGSGGSLKFADGTVQSTAAVAQVNSDWNATSGTAQILNKPTLATVATSGSYTDLTNKPTITSGTVTSVSVSSSDLTVSGSPITTSGTISLSLNTVPVAKGGTGLTSLTAGALHYSSSSTAFGQLASVATGSVLTSQGTGVAPAWGKVALTSAVSGVLNVANGGTGQNGWTTGALIYGGANLNQLNPVATGSVLLSAGTNTPPTWGKVALASVVSGTLPVANGGTGLTITGAAKQYLRVNSAGSALEYASLTASDMSGLATVATSGSYTDLINKPVESRLYLDVSAGGTFTLTDAQFANAILDFYGSLAGNVIIVVPQTIHRFTVITNAITANGHTVSIKTSGASVYAPLVIPTDSVLGLTCDGTGVFSDAGYSLNGGFTGAVWTTNADGSLGWVAPPVGVTSVGISSSTLTVSSSPITSSGTIQIDIPAGANGQVLSTNGSGQVVWAAAPTGTIPSQSGNAGKYLTTDGTNASWQTLSGGSTGSNLLNVQVFKTSGTYTPTSGTNTCIVEMVGGGGGGSGLWTQPDGNAGAAGGGGGGYVHMKGPVANFAGQAVTVGAGGSAGVGTSADYAAPISNYSGGDGGNTTFGASGSVAYGGTGGASGGWTNTGTMGTAFFYPVGGSGGSITVSDGFDIGSFSGGGGGSDQTQNINANLPSGGGSKFSAFGQLPYCNAAGSALSTPNASNYGAGGAGAGTGGNSGGAGAHGIVIIWEFS
ncbi:hypothetical protein ACAX43_12550 [Paraburkholderia sp. IW21]|uniref:hypothetical protein n=1 Tax=Paraburkholderia sp. IW21 TaxID=3242488 RepID=UPI00352273E3